MKYTRYRVVLSKYIQNDFPNTTAISGIIVKDQEEAKINAVAMLKDLFDKRFTTNICPNMGFDPLKYEIDTVSSRIIWYHHDIDEREPVFNTTYTDVTCVFTDTTNYIIYRAMKITKYHDKWYVSSKFNDQIIGIIDDKDSLNEICTEADKIWEHVKIDHKEPKVILTDN